MQSSQNQGGCAVPVAHKQSRKTVYVAKTQTRDSSSLKKHFLVNYEILYVSDFGCYYHPS